VDDAESEPAAAGTPNTHPTGFWFFFWGEFAERASYYGMRAILPLYMTSRIHLSDDQAAEWYSYFKAACYLLPLLGGYLADRFFGRYWTIVGFSVPYVVGQLIIGIENSSILVLALLLLAGGSGVIKPNISALMGQTYDQQRPGNTTLRANAFLWFYFSINVGSTISMVALPMVRDRFGYQVAFFIPAILMAAALLVFALGKRYYARETPGVTPVMDPEERRRQIRGLGPLFAVFFLMVFFWVAYEHNDNLWVFFARDHLYRSLPAWLGGFELAPDQFQFINAALILVFVPLSQWFWPKVDPTGRRFPHTTKILLGFLSTALAPATMAGASAAADATGGKVTAMWLVVAYFFLTVGEVLVYGTGLDLSYAYAPPSMKGFVTACFLLTIAGGNLINTQYAPLYETRLPATWLYLTDVAIVLVAAFAFYFVGRSFNRSRLDRAAT
jgi:dipeptide/tripeptide permease